jgi:predicted enzyme related to lactoylglutathione lyase
MPRPIHFDLTAENPDRAMNFYKDVFGWKFEKWDGPMEYWMITTGEGNESGINGGLSRRGQHSMPNMNTIGVSSADKFSKIVQDKGGKILMPKTPIPGVGWFVTCQDTEGNIFGLIEENRDAK